MRTQLAILLAGVPWGLMSPPAAAQIGEVRVNAGMASGVEAGGLPVRAGGSASFAFVASSLSFGPEVLFFPGGVRVSGLAGVARLHLARQGQGFRPYLIASLGGTQWKGADLGTNLLTGSLGVGVPIGSGLTTFTVEARAYENLQRLGPGSNKWTFLTLTGGMRFTWR